MMMKTKEWLKEQRVKYSLTQQQLANEIGVTKFTIENIEQGRRLGSVDTWNKIENYFENSDDDLINISYNSNDLIEELKVDIEEFGEEHKCILIYKVVNDNIVFTNYDFICEEEPFNPDKELLENEYYLETTFKYALEVFENQNKTF